MTGGKNKEACQAAVNMLIEEWGWDWVLRACSDHAAERARKLNKVHKGPSAASRSWWARSCRACEAEIE